jgi:pyruvate kinase
VRIVREIEGSGVLQRGPRYLLWDEERVRSGATPREHAVASATVESVRQLRSPAVIVITRSGFSARLVSSYRPPVPIFAVCTDRRTYHQLPPVWGIHPVLVEGSDLTYDALLEVGRHAVLESGVGRPGQSIVVTSGYPFHIQGTTNTMRIEQL